MRVAVYPRAGYVPAVSERGRGPVEAFLKRLRRRAALVHAVRGAIGALGAGALVFGLGALAMGPLSEPALAAAVWALLVGVVASVSSAALRRARRLRGAGTTALLDVVAADLPSAARSAWELRRAPPAHASRAMIAAHEAAVASKLASVRPAQVVSWRMLRHPHVLAGTLALAAGLGALGTERGGAGAYALVHPGERDAQGERVAVAFQDVEARLIFPSYLARDPVEVADPSVLEVPRGTSIELRARPRMEAAEAALRVNDRTLPMELDGAGRFVGRFVARADTTVHLRLRRPEGDWVRDAAQRRVRALADAPPQVSLLDPTDDLLIAEPREVRASWVATDDVGVAAVDLVVSRGPGTEPERRRLNAYPEDRRPLDASGQIPIDLALLGMARGDAITFWIEARDGDVVSGPNVARSAEVTVTLESEASRRESRLDDLRALLDQTLGLLADRLERPAPEADAEAPSRYAALAPPTEALVAALRARATRMRDEEGGREADAALLRSMGGRVRRLLREEGALHGSRPASHERRAAVDARFTTELEDDVLTLDDLLSRARIEDAAEIARELEQIRREIRSLLAELQRTDSPEARARLLEAIGRAQRRMGELMQRLAQMGTSVPEEFTNAGEAAGGETASTLEAMREAVQRGDLARAEELARELQGQIDALARALGDSGESFAQSRFGPRDRAMANAMEALTGLESEQSRLARRGTERRSRAAHRALESIGGRDNRVGRRLAEDTARVREALEEVTRQRLAGFEQDAYDRARQRLVDAEDALRAGDLGEGRAMSEAAAQDLGALSRDLDLSALMFPGHDGETSEDARQARAADRRLGDLRRQLDEALPDVARHLEAPDRQQMRDDLARQREAQDAAEGLSEQFARGPDGTPLSEDAAREVGEASRTMEDAERALERGDPLESARLQEEAARRLSELREQLEQQQEQQSGGGGGGGSELDFTRPVEIPGAEEFEGPMEMRRRLLDAMRESTPEGYEDAVRRYYEGLLR